jgi:hypothetical protein
MNDNTEKPIAVLFQDGSIVRYEDLEFVPEKSGQLAKMLYTKPSTWQCLSGEEIFDLWPDDLSLFKWQDLAHKIEDILWEKNK